MGPRIGLAMERRKILCPCQELGLGHPTCSLVAMIGMNEKIEHTEVGTINCPHIFLKYMKPL
jgi:hypothetical protein